MTLSSKNGVLAAVLALGFCTLYFLLHVHFMQQFLDWDQVWYLQKIEKMLKPWSGSVYNPHHLHFETGGKWFHLLMTHCFGKYGFTDLAFNDRIRSLLTACVGLFFIILFISQITGRLMWGVLGGFMISMSRAYLVHATKVDTPIYPAAGLLVLVYLMYRFQESRKHAYLYACVCGIALFINVMFHQYMGLACVLLFTAMVIPPELFQWQWLRHWIITRPARAAKNDRSLRQRTIAALILTATATVLIVGAYVYAGHISYGLYFDRPNPAHQKTKMHQLTFQKWLFLYEVLGHWGKGFKQFDFRDTIRGYTNGFLAPATVRYLWYASKYFRYDFKRPFHRNRLPYTAVAVFTFFAIGAILFFLPELLRRYGRVFLFMLSCFIGFAAFTTYWLPIYVEFWVIPSSMLITLCVLTMNMIGEKIGRLTGPVIHVPLYGSLLAVTVLMAVHNYHHHLIPYSRFRISEDRQKFTKEEFERFFSRDIYKHPWAPYKTIYQKKMTVGETVK